MEPQFNMGMRVRVKDCPEARAWGHANALGTISGDDPKGRNPAIVAVRLDSGPSLYDVKGIHISYLEPVEQPPKGKE